MYLLPIQKCLVEAQARCRAMAYYNLPVDRHVCCEAFALPQNDAFYERLSKVVPKEEGLRRQHLLR